MVEVKTILILGGYGNTGRPLARLLLQETDARLVIAGRNFEKAKSFTEELNHAVDGNRVRPVYADASNLEKLKQAFTGVDFVVVASSTTQYAPQVAEAALETRIGYLDIQISTHKIAVLKSLEEKIREAGCCFITDGGFHPGLPAFMVRYVAQYFDQLLSARVGSVIKEDWKSLEVDDSTIYELVELMNDYQMISFKGGQWKKSGMLSMSDFITMDFGELFGKQYCAPMLLEEMRLLPQIYPTLMETGFYVGSFNWVVDWLIMPLTLVAMKIAPQVALKPMARWMRWGLNTFSKPPYGTMLKLEATGIKDGQSKSMKIIIAHPDGYMFTAIPVAACLLQYLDGTIANPGVRLQAHIVEPNRFMRDMQRMGITVQKTNGGSDEMESQ